MSRCLGPPMLYHQSIPRLTITLIAALCAAPLQAKPSGPAASPISARCTAVDGDTMRCTWPGQSRPQRVRLLGIDAPEMPGHCRRGRACAPGDPLASTASLSRAIAGRSLTLSVVGQDRWGRPLVTSSIAGQDLSCLQLAARMAVYVEKWDNQGRVARMCPAVVRSARVLPAR